MHLNLGQFRNTQVLSSESVSLMHTLHISRYLHGEAGYGLSLFTDRYKGVRRVVHWGLQAGYWCVMNLFPDQGIGVVVQSNYGDETTIVALVDRIYDDLLDLPANRTEPTQAAPDRSQWPLHEGTYLSLAYGFVTVQISEHQLVLDDHGHSWPLVAIEGGLYQAGRTQVGFVSEANQPTQYLMFDGQPYRRIALDPSFTPDPATWITYAGTYEDIKDDPYPIRIRVTDTQLLMKWGNDAEVVCTALSQTRFVSHRGVIDFEVAQDTSAPVLIAREATYCHRRNETLRAKKL